jgi:hypothetical protein
VYPLLREGKALEIVLLEAHVCMNFSKSSFCLQIVTIKRHQKRTSPGVRSHHTHTSMVGNSFEQQCRSGAARCDESVNDDSRLGGDYGDDDAVELMSQEAIVRRCRHDNERHGDNDDVDDDNAVDDDDNNNDDLHAIGRLPASKVSRMHDSNAFPRGHEPVHHPGRCRLESSPRRRVSFARSYLQSDHRHPSEGLQGLPPHRSPTAAARSISIASRAAAFAEPPVDSTLGTLYVGNRPGQFSGLTFLQQQHSMQQQQQLQQKQDQHFVQQEYQASPFGYHHQDSVGRGIIAGQRTSLKSQEWYRAFAMNRPSGAFTHRLPLLHNDDLSVLASMGFDRNHLPTSLDFPSGSISVPLSTPSRTILDDWIYGQLHAGVDRRGPASMIPAASQTDYYRSVSTGKLEFPIHMVHSRPISEAAYALFGNEYGYASSLADCGNNRMDRRQKLQRQQVHIPVAAARSRGCWSQSSDSIAGMAEDECNDLTTEEHRQPVRRQKQLRSNNQKLQNKKQQMLQEGLLQHHETESKKSSQVRISGARPPPDIQAAEFYTPATGFPGHGVVASTGRGTNLPKVEFASPAIPCKTQPAHLVSALPVAGQMKERKHGRITRCLPTVLYTDCDQEYLTTYQCLLRKQLELFIANEDDVRCSAQQGRISSVQVGQVGLRCRHCHGGLASRTKGAVYYSQTIEGLYQIAQNMSKHCCERCYCIPPDLRLKLLELRNDSRRATSGKEYWTDRIRALGVYEVDGTLRVKTLDQNDSTITILYQDGEDDAYGNDLAMVKTIKKYKRVDGSKERKRKKIEFR